MQFQCPHCQTVLKLKSQAAGKKGPCPSCSQIIEIPQEQPPQEEEIPLIPLAPEPIDNPPEPTNDATNSLANKNHDSDDENNSNYNHNPCSPTHIRTRNEVKTLPYILELLYAKFHWLGPALFLVVMLLAIFPTTLRHPIRNLYDVAENDILVRSFSSVDEVPLLETLFFHELGEIPSPAPGTCHLMFACQGPRWGTDHLNGREIYQMFNALKCHADVENKAYEQPSSSNQFIYTAITSNDIVRIVSTNQQTHRITTPDYLVYLVDDVDAAQMWAHAIQDEDVRYRYVRTSSAPGEIIHFQTRSLNVEFRDFFSGPYYSWPQPQATLGTDTDETFYVADLPETDQGPWYYSNSCNYIQFGNRIIEAQLNSSRMRELRFPHQGFHRMLDSQTEFAALQTSNDRYLPDLEHGVAALVIFNVPTDQQYVLMQNNQEIAHFSLPLTRFSGPLMWLIYLLAFSVCAIGTIALTATASRALLHSGAEHIALTTLIQIAAIAAIIIAAAYAAAIMLAYGSQGESILAMFTAIIFFIPATIALIIVAAITRNTCHLRYA
ncbi:MAG: hypothetical protein JW936_05360 [Sedimentisphaerales bacterium]|nr:hypothetical protein [Sedimentisphaerales bacterium]